MVDIEKAFLDKIKLIISEWNESDIYAISFFVDSNDMYAYRGFDNVSFFALSFNAESDCPGADTYDEERWNYAFWRQDETPIIDPDEENELTDMLFDWYEENEITNIGEEEGDAYDEECNYIGKGPVGHYELLSIVANVAANLQEEGFIEKQFGKRIPIIVHGLEYAWFDIEATRKANPHGEAKVFLEAMKRLGFF